MRRKVIQEFANSFCQRLLDLPEGDDLASFAHYGSGTYRANILAGECSHNLSPIPKLKFCDVYQQWLYKQLDNKRIRLDDLLAVALRIEVGLTDLKVRKPFGQQFASARFSFDCHSEIKTDEKSYFGHMLGEKEWGFDFYYLRSYGAFPASWPVDLTPYSAQSATTPPKDRTA